MRRGGITITMPPLKLVQRFVDELRKSAPRENGIHVPRNPNFPAIDFIWKQDKTVWGVQVHTP